MIDFESHPQTMQLRSLGMPRDNPVYHVVNGTRGETTSSMTDKQQLPRLLVGFFGRMSKVESQGATYQKEARSGYFIQVRREIVDGIATSGKTEFQAAQDKQ